MQREKERCKYSKFNKLAPALCLWKGSLRPGWCHQCNEFVRLSSRETWFLFHCRASQSCCAIWDIFCLWHSSVRRAPAGAETWDVFCFETEEHRQERLLLCWFAPHLNPRPFTSVPSTGHFPVWWKPFWKSNLFLGSSPR